MEIVRLSKGHGQIVSIGDWFIPVVMMRAGRETAMEFFSESRGCLENVSNSAALGSYSVVNALEQVFSLFLGQSRYVFDLLREAKENNEVTWRQEITDPRTNQARESVTKKSYAEVAKEVEECFIVLISIITEVEQESSKTEATEKMIISLTKVLKADGDFVELRLRLLQFLYNSFGPKNSFRYAIFMSIMKYAKQQNVFDQVARYIDYVDSWMVDWGLTSNQKRALFGLLSDELKELKRDEESRDFLLRYVNELQGCPEEINETVNKNYAVRLAVDSVKLPRVVYVDEILALDAVKNLANNGNQVVLDLLYIFLRGSSEDLASFFEKNAEFCKKHELNHEDCLKNWRLLTIAACGAGQREAITLESISETLGLSPQEAEELVVQAIGQNLLDAKIDQIRQVVLVRSATEREFTDDNWVVLQSRINQWITNTKQIQEIFKERAGK